MAASRLFPSIRVEYLKLHTQKHDNYQTFTSLLKLKAIGMDVKKKDNVEISGTEIK